MDTHVSMDVGCYDLMHPTKKTTLLRIVHPTLEKALNLDLPEDFRDEHVGDEWDDIVEAGLYAFIDQTWWSSNLDVAKNFLAGIEDVRADFQIAWAQLEKRRLEDRWKRVNAILANATELEPIE